MSWIFLLLLCYKLCMNDLITGLSAAADGPFGLVVALGHQCTYLGVDVRNE